MDILAIGFVVAVALELDWIGFKYRSMLFPLVAGILVLLTLAGVAADNSVSTYHYLASNSTIVSANWQPTGADSKSWLALFAMLAVLAIMQFVMVIERTMEKGTEF